LLACTPTFGKVGGQKYFPLAPLANLVLYPHLKIHGAAHAHGGREGGREGKRREGREGTGREGGRPGMPESRVGKPTCTCNKRFLTLHSKAIHIQQICSSTVTSFQSSNCIMYIHCSHRHTHTHTYQYLSKTSAVVKLMLLLTV